MKYETLVEIVNSVKGTKFASIDTTTEVKLTGGKKNPFQGRVTKKTSNNMVIMTNTPENVYSNMVKKRLVEEGKDFKEFELKPRKWGIREGDTCIIDHNGKKYLEAIFVRGGDSVYYVDGVETDPDKIEGLPEKKMSEESQGGLEDKVIIRTFASDSIDNIRINHKEYVE